jgi:cold shock CspA family protein
MQVPLEITFEHIGHSEPIEARIRDEAKKLEEFYGRITSARVVVGRPQRRHVKGDTYQVRIHLTIPGAANIVIDRDPAATGAHEDVYVAIRDAFKAARRVLQDVARERQGHVKVHQDQPRGVIASLRSDEDHGFITSMDGREIYFHRNSVEGGAFDALSIGDAVRYSEEMGVKGPQATFVRPGRIHHSS